MGERQYLKKKILLWGKSDGAGFQRSFNIVKMIDEGASVICYEAYHENSGRGILKEFYPRSAYGLERNPKGQLVHAEGFGDAYQRFLKAEKEYLEPYEMLLEVRQNSSDQELSTFIPAFEIYRGGEKEEDARGTVYIWTPEPKLETFDKVCEEIHKHPCSHPEHKLVLVLSAMESLVKCTCALHSAGMLHRDIKPSNFGFLKRGKETLTQALSMFDINSICSVYGNISKGMGTEGYLEPEAGYQEANNQTDIYAIGATLFHAIIVSDEAREGGYRYQSKYYGRIREMVSNSELIQASEANSHPKLRNLLGTILQRCLCKRSGRYESCEELLEDLEAALYYALPSEVARKGQFREKWVLKDIEKSLDRNKEKNSSLAIQYHLYEYPLYQCLPKNEKELNVLVIGFGNYGQKFLDACLQAGQMRGKNLNVTVLSDDATDQEIYLSERPELPDFFDIEASLADANSPLRDSKGHVMDAVEPLADIAETYGTITFMKKELKGTADRSHVEALKKCMEERYGNQHPHYVFIALGEDSLNFAVANACKIAVEASGEKCMASYICEGGQPLAKQTPRGKRRTLCPLYVNFNRKQTPLYPEMERMAFNTHLVWEKNLNLDYKTMKADFRKSYNHDACVSNVLSLKYKLYSLGIDLGAGGFAEAAHLFREILSDRSNAAIREELIWMEHRRWVTEKLCLGWRRIRNLEDCAGGMTKDEKKKRHVCIVKSRPGQKLAEEYSIKDDPGKWDQASDSELEQLDELDRMSVKLHRMYSQRAAIVRTQNLLSGNSIAGMRNIIEGNKEAVAAFGEWLTCLKAIYHGDRAKFPLYKGLKHVFLQTVDALSKERKKSIQEQVKAFEAMFYPILASMEYRDWKKDDVALIDNIPFILTYTEDVYMVIPFAAGDNTQVFGNVAAPTVASPAKILYLFLVEKGKDIQNLWESLPYVVGYMEKRCLKAAVEMILLSMDTAAGLAAKKIEQEIIRIGKGRIRQVKWMKLDGTREAAVELEAYLRQRSRGKKAIAVEKNATGLSYMLQGAGFYHLFPSYQFDSGHMEFQALSGCDMLGYIQKKPYITVKDMAAFRLSSSDNSDQPEFFYDYSELWEMYCKKRGVWKLLCGILGSYAEENDVLVSLNKKAQKEKTAQAQEYCYIIPSFCQKSVAKIICFLVGQDILEAASQVNGYTTDSCKAVIVDRCGYQREYDRLFSNVYALMLPEAIAFCLDKGREVKVAFDSLAVAGVSAAGSRSAELCALMEYFKEKEYVINLVITPEKEISFTYASRQIKELLTDAGKMLKIYTYHKIKDCGYFDDVVSGLGIEWQGTEVKSEFDCILTKEFRTLFIECRAQADIGQEPYFRLAGLAQQFGINATAVLVADTEGESHSENVPANIINRKRGRMMGVVTIWRPEEISDIGNTLRYIMDGSYGNVDGMDGDCENADESYLNVGDIDVDNENADCENSYESYPNVDDIDVDDENMDDINMEEC